MWYTIYYTTSVGRCFHICKHCLKHSFIRHLIFSLRFLVSWQFLASKSIVKNFYRFLLENLSWMENWTVHTPRNLSGNWNNQNSVRYLLQAFLLQGIFLWHSCCSCFCHNNILYFDSNYYNWGYLWDLEKGQGISMLWILQTFVIINFF